ncbi:hypothetical protein LOY64_04590 [Pseudomonas corrugata]|uniref:hypothetical protein n=1 Tax=Pseudomonas corrugata TaxID=47879 RepID=UPI0004BBBD0F|nr:hypothetical protein [Pseudomonas corrugata]MDU9024043.1 hypothetical protein [Pseudomonas corrugata]MDU9033118.1 hypothetical protein [Pseudomonas corrugata]MDU9039105.1 hypothetical protein [Pseudomonas corrugata]UZD98452.1 hypothetical protein LOY64_04590 [Pseudomonas corrugata]UZE09088.1 hypothetical protein LOY65_03920 [Pseudomonas corrugata]
MENDEVDKHLDLQSNAQKLTDETCYDKASSIRFANQPAGRTALLSTNVHF